MRSTLVGGLALVAACGVTDPGLSAFAVQPTAPPPVEWWTDMETCSGRTGDFGAVRWYTLVDTTATEFATPWGPAVGLYLPDTHAIIVAAPYLGWREVVAHEMLHALGVRGHPAVFQTCGVGFSL